MSRRIQWRYFLLHYAQTSQRPQNGSTVTTVCGKNLIFPGPQKDGTVLQESCDACVLGCVEGPPDDPKHPTTFEVLEDTKRRS